MVSQQYKGLPKENDQVIVVVEKNVDLYTYKKYNKKKTLPCDAYCDLQEDGFCCCVNCQLRFGYRFERSTRCKKNVELD